MLSNLMLCNQIVSDRQNLSSPGDKFDFASTLHEEWLKLYPHSILSARSIKSRLTVYLKTIGDGPSPKRRKLAQQEFSWTSDKKGILETLLGKY